MNATEHTAALAPGLYFIATPLGNARDITLRALDILRSAEVLAAEDTRSLKRLMEIHGVPLNGRRIIAYHDHNGAAQRPSLLRKLAEGQSVAYASEAGTPLIADPGYALGRDAIAGGHPVFAAPGATAALAALTASGLPSDRFLFVGFPPPSSGARKTFFAEIAGIEATLILYESPKRLGRMLADASAVLGAEREVAVCRELTKKFEEIRRGALGDLAAAYADETVRGEVVVCIGKGTRAADPEAVEEALRAALTEMPLKAAAREVADRFGVSKRDVYQLGVKLRGAD